MPMTMPIARLGTGRARRGRRRRAQGAQSKCQEQCSQNPFVHDFPLALWVTRGLHYINLDPPWSDAAGLTPPQGNLTSATANDKKDEGTYLFTLRHHQI